MVQWRGRRRSSNVEDRRGSRVKRGAVGGGAGLLVALVLALFFDVDPSVVLDGGGGGAAPAAPGEAYAPSPAEEEQRRFVEVILAETEDAWNGIFADRGSDYPEPTLVLFTGAVESACGIAGSAVGPFYCPGDRQVYLDLSFFDDLSRRLGAGGDFARAYVVAHEVGHHVQTVTGEAESVRALQRGVSEAEANALQVRMELQADCYAGVWGHFARQRGIVEPGDLEEALGAAAAIGDDRLQRRSQGYVVPESFTHGTSAQRVRWFRTGFESGDPGRCDTFAPGAVG